MLALKIDLWASILFLSGLLCKEKGSENEGKI